MDRPIELRWTYRTRDGRPVKVLCVDRKGPLPIVVLIENDMLVSLYPDGRATNSLGTTPIDLVRCPEVHNHLMQFHTGAGKYQVEIRIEDMVPVSARLVMEIE